MRMHRPNIYIYLHVRLCFDIEGP